MRVWGPEKATLLGPPEGGGRHQKTDLAQAFLSFLRRCPAMAGAGRGWGSSLLSPRGNGLLPALSVQPGGSLTSDGGSQGSSFTGICPPSSLLPPVPSMGNVLLLLSTCELHLSVKAQPEGHLHQGLFWDPHC